MVIGLTNQLLATFGEDYQGQLAHPKEMVLALCTSRQDQALLKSYPPFHLHLWISIARKSSRSKTNVKG
jgi:hypothetical protein